MGRSSSLRLVVLLALRLKGLAEAPAIAEMMDVDVDAAVAELADLERAGLVTYRPGRLSGHILTDVGRAEGEALLRAELEATGVRPQIEHAYDGFLRVNGDLLAVCTAWQIREVDGRRETNDHTDAAHDTAVREQLMKVHEQLEPVLVELGGALARFSGHQRRLQTALDRVLAGDHDYFTKPMFPSYHSTWFELHEDLLATLDRQRASEGNS